MEKTVQKGEYFISHTNEKEFKNLSQEIFAKHIYYFETKSKSPSILDLGAHIGLSVLYFKKLFPQSKITALEPHPLSFALLKKNINQNNLSGIKIINAAVSAGENTRTLYVDPDWEWNSTSSFIPGSWTQNQKTQPILVKSEKFSHLLIHPTDIVKMDIEGAEWEILTQAREELQNISKLILESHYLKGNHANGLIKHLKKYGLALSNKPQTGKKLQILEFTKLG